MYDPGKRMVGGTHLQDYFIKEPWKNWDNLYKFLSAVPCQTEEPDFGYFMIRGSQSHFGQQAQ